MKMPKDGLYDAKYEGMSAESIYKSIESDGLRVLVDKKSYLFLIGTEIDYVETMMSSGFEFNSPLAKNSCGCGESVGF